MATADIPVHVAPESEPPFAVEALAVEEDTYFVLGAAPELREPTGHPLRVWTEAHEAEPARPGSVAVREGKPLRLLAVVHDLSRDPSWREEWVAESLDEILRQAHERGIRSLGLPPLGGVHGRLPPSRFAELLEAALSKRPDCGIERLWLVVSAGRRREFERLLCAP